MKRVWGFGLMLMLVAAAAAQSSESQPLGDYARTAKKAKPAVKPVSKTYDNDNLPSSPTPSAAGKETAAAADSDVDGDDSKDAKDKTAAENPAAKKDAEAAKGSDAKVKPAEDGKEKSKAGQEAWKQKLEGQKQKIDLLSRELNVLQREYQIRAAAFYADVGNRLRNAGQWDTDDRKYKQQIADKQKAVDDAKTQLSDLQEQARKAGVRDTAE
jgi:hypothetical protein